MVTYSVFLPLLHIKISIKKKFLRSLSLELEEKPKLIIFIFSDFHDGGYSKVFNKI